MVRKNNSGLQKGLHIVRPNARTFYLLLLIITAVPCAHSSLAASEAQQPKQPPVDSLPYYLGLAEKGQVEAQAELGTMYLEGRGVQQSYPEPLKWFRKAADKGNDAAQFHLGAMYAKGWGSQGIMTKQ
jgi:TPR repeat protein